MDKRQWFVAKPDGSGRRQSGLSPAVRHERELARSAADVTEAERRLARQIVLIDESDSRGDSTVEASKALARLKQDVSDMRDRHGEMVRRGAAEAGAEKPATSA